VTDPNMALQGVNGQVELFPDQVIIRRKGVISKLTQGFFAGEKSIYINQITGIKVKQAGLFTNGFIQFALAGNLETKRALLKQTQDESTVFFRRAQNGQVAGLKAHIERLMAARGQPSTSAPTSTADELLKLKGLLNDGVLSQEEFDSQKQKLLAR